MNKLMPQHNSDKDADNCIKCIFLNFRMKSFIFFYQILLMFFPMGPIYFTHVFSMGPIYNKLVVIIKSNKDSRGSAMCLTFPGITCPSSSESRSWTRAV